MIQCVAGECFIVEFHLDLGGNTEGDRTVLGNPENAVDYGFEKGTFFIIDPTVKTSGEKFKRSLLKSAGFLIIGGVVLTLCMCIGIAVAVRSKKPKVQQAS